MILDRETRLAKFAVVLAVTKLPNYSESVQHKLKYDLHFRRKDVYLCQLSTTTPFITSGKKDKGCTLKRTLTISSLTQSMRDLMHQ